MNKEELTDFFKKLETLSFPEQLETIKSELKDPTTRSIMGDNPEWIKWCATNKEKIIN